MATIGSAIDTNAATAIQLTAGSPSSATASKQGLEQTANKETFLKLLVAQIRNQDPLNPSDGTQFLTQLAQFSQLEQLINIRSGIDALNSQVSESSAKSEAQTASAPQKQA